MIAETQACHDDPFLHGCTYSALSADERAPAEERAPEGQTVAVDEGGGGERVRVVAATAVRRSRGCDHAGRAAAPRGSSRGANAV